jgi:hypothetical protein
MSWCMMAKTALPCDFEAGEPIAHEASGRQSRRGTTTRENLSAKPQENSTLGGKRGIACLKL